MKDYTPKSETQPQLVTVMHIYSLRPDEISNSIEAPFLVVMPVYNESANIADVVEEWLSALAALPVTGQMLLLNDGSTDNTLAIMRNLAESNPNRLIVVDKLNGGHGATCRLGYEIAVKSSCEWILQIDSDGQCDATYLSKFWDAHDAYDFILGLRVRRGDGFMRALTSKACRFVSSIIVGCNLKDPNVPYRLMRRDALSSVISQIPANFNIHNVALTYAMHRYNTFKIHRVPISFRARAGGENSLDIPKVLYWGAAMLFELAILKRSLRKNAN